MQEINNASESRINKLKAMLEQQPEDCFLLHALGLEYVKLANSEERIANRVEELANSQQELGFRGKAIKYFEQVLAIDPNYVGTYYHLALALANEGRDSKAVFDKGIAVAQALKDKHAESELRMAYDEIFDEEWEW